MQIAEFLKDRRVSFEPLPHAPAFSAHKLAKYLGVRGAEVAKAVLLRGPTPNDYLLAVLPATHQVDLSILSQAMGRSIRLATQVEVAACFRDCEWGVVPPFGNLYGLETLLDESFHPDMLIVLETQTHVEAVRLCCQDYEQLAGSRRLAFARQQSRKYSPSSPGTTNSANSLSVPSASGMPNRSSKQYQDKGCTWVVLE